MANNLCNMSDDEIKKIVDDFFNKTSKETLIDIFEKSGFFKEFSYDEINWDVFINNVKDKNNHY